MEIFTSDKRKTYPICKTNRTFPGIFIVFLRCFIPEKVFFISFLRALSCFLICTKKGGVKSCGCLTKGDLISGVQKNKHKLIRIPYTHFHDLCIEDLFPETSAFCVTF